MTLINRCDILLLAVILGAITMMKKQRFNYLLRQISKSEKAFDELYDYYYLRIMYRYSPSFGKTFVEDCIQDFFVKIMENGAASEYIENPTVWVFTCCENIIKTKLSKLRKEVPLDNDVEDKMQQIVVDNMEILNGALKILDDISARIIIYHYYYGYSFKELAQLLGVNYATVRKKHERAIKKIKNFLK